MEKGFSVLSIIIQISVLGLFFLNLASISSNNEWFVNTIYVAYLLFSVCLFLIFKTKVNSEDKSYKTPFFLSVVTIISTLPHAIIQNEKMIREGYGEVEYDNKGAYLDGGPDIWTHTLDFDPTNLVFLISLILSAIFISLWHKYKNEFKWLN